MPPRKQKHDDSAGASLTRISVAVLLLVNFILWGIAVAMFQNASGALTAEPVTIQVGAHRRWNLFTALLSALMGIVMFIMSAITTLPQAASVISFIVSQRVWYVVLVLVVNAVLIGFLFWMQKVEQDLNSGRAFGKRKR